MSFSYLLCNISINSLFVAIFIDFIISQLTYLLIVSDVDFLLDGFLNNECQNLLKTLSWKNYRVRKGIPKKWIEKWSDIPKVNEVRLEIKKLVNEIKTIKKIQY